MILLILLSAALSLAGCSSEPKYGEDDNGAALIGPCIICGDSTYSSAGSGVTELPDGCIIEQDTFSQTMHSFTINEYSEFYINTAKDTIYCARNGGYDIYTLG